jgi:hypothetical protein
MPSGKDGGLAGVVGAVGVASIEIGARWGDAVVLAFGFLGELQPATSAAKPKKISIAHRSRRCRVIQQE